MAVQREPAPASPRRRGEYLLYQEIAAGGIGSVCLARTLKQAGFSRVLAVKTLHPQHAKNARFVTMFLDEARMAARVRHPNVVSVLDVVTTDEDPFLVMEYIAGESLSKLLATTSARGGRVDPAIAASIMGGVLEGLHAAHHASNERGVPLQIVHRDVSPQNVLVGVDGVARVVDFGIAKAIGRAQETTQEGHIKGKVSYMPPEQLIKGPPVDHRSDVWSASVVLWEMLTGRRLFMDAAEAMQHHASGSPISAPSELGAPDVLDAVVMKGLAHAMDDRFQTAREMLVAIDRAISPAPARRVASWVQKLARETLLKHAAYVKAIEADAASTMDAPRLTGPAAARDESVSADPTRPAPVSGASVPPAPPHIIGRYALYGEIAAGGMATIHYGRLLGPVGFSRTVAVKRLHPQYAKDPGFAAMFIDEARLSARIVHPNVVQTLDVVALEDELFLVMEYVAGTSLAFLLRAARKTGEERIPLPVASAILCGVLHGLHSAHEATSERGEPLGLVHRDVSPQNVLVSVEGVARVLDFGIAKAAGRLNATQEGHLKGKLAYMAPEQLSGGVVDRRTDVFAAGVLLWEVLTGRRLFAGESQAETLGAVLTGNVSPPSTVVPGLPPELDDVCMRALDRDPARRFESALAMAVALERHAAVASPTAVAACVRSLASEELRGRAELVLGIERNSELGQVQEVHQEPVSAAPSREPPRPRKGRIVVLALPALTLLMLVAWYARHQAASELHARPLTATVPSSVPEPTAVSAVVTPAPSLIPPPAASARILHSTAPHKGAHPVLPATSQRPCAVRTHIDSAGITHFIKDCK